MLRYRCVVSCSLLLILASNAFAAEPLAKRFAAADANGDKKVSLEELLKLPGEKPVLTRDFRLFDLDENGTLSPEEFDAIPLGRPAAERGAIPDPFLEILNRAVAQLDEAYGQWDRNPKMNVNVADFVQSFLMSFPIPNRVVSFPEELQKDADENSNNRVTRDEARRFLEIQLGLRRSDGRLLRLLNGQVVINTAFVALDTNRDQTIDHAEFIAGWPRKEKLDDQWKKLDKNGDNKLSFDEFLMSPESAVADPVEQFRKCDANLDAFVDEKELLAGSPAADQPLAKHAFPGFDLNGDKKLNLWEFRQLPQSNPVLSWNMELADLNRDGALQYLEFSSYGGRFPLLRLIYFYRFDVDGNGTLDPKEFPFKTWPPQSLYRLNADGSGWKVVFSSEKYPTVGSPKISRDGKWLVCDAEQRDQKESGRKMLLMTIDGQDVREIGPGMMPTWSPNGKQIVFSNGGVQLLDLETNRVRTLESNGWSGQWAPGGNLVAFTQGSAIKTIDVETERVTDILPQADTPYQQIYWNIGWSADGKRICFKGVRKAGQAEIASVSVENPPDLKVHYDGPRVISNNFTWSPDGKRIVFGMHAADAPRMLMHEFNPNEKAEPILLKGPDLSLQSHDSCWSPDGKFLILNGRPD